MYKGENIVALKKREKINPKELLKKSLSQKIEEELKEKGVYQFSPEKELNINEDYLNLPSEITEVMSKDLGEYLNAYTQQKMYMRTLIGWTECLIEEARREYNEVAIKYYKVVNKTKMSEKAKDIEVNNEEEVLPFYNALIDLKVKKSMLEYNLASIEDAIFLISREVSRRNGDFNDENRNHNVGRK